MKSIHGVQSHLFRLKSSNKKADYSWSKREKKFSLQIVNSDATNKICTDVLVWLTFMLLGKQAKHRSRFREVSAVKEYLLEDKHNDSNLFSIEDHLIRWYLRVRVSPFHQLCQKISSLDIYFDTPLSKFHQYTARKSHKSSLDWGFVTLGKSWSEFLRRFDIYNIDLAVSNIN